MLILEGAVLEGSRGLVSRVISEVALSTMLVVVYMILTDRILERLSTPKPQTWIAVGSSQASESRTKSQYCPILRLDSALGHDVPCKPHML